MEYFKKVKRRNAERVANVLISSIQSATNMPETSFNYATRFLTAFLMAEFSNSQLIDYYDGLKLDFIEITDIFNFINNILYFYEH